MRTIGIIGGMGPEATVDYYKRISSFFERHKGGVSKPEIIIHSVDIDVLFELLSSGRRAVLADWLHEKLLALRVAGADLAAIAANSPHIVFDTLASYAPMPLVSVVDATRRAVVAGGWRQVGLLGTRFTMQAGFYASNFERDGIRVITPAIEEQNYIHDKIVREIERGEFHADTRRRFLEIADTMMRRDGIEALILGCTELPFLLRSGDMPLPFLNTTELHVGEICRRCIER